MIKGLRLTGTKSNGYKLVFKTKARKEWDKLPPAIRELFSSKLKRLRTTPRVPANRLSGMKDCYKIKLRSIGYRLVYQVIDDQLIICVISIGKRERNRAYNAAKNRL